MNKANELKDTLNLPQTDFPMRANAVQREPERLKHWDEIGVYQLIQEKNAPRAARGEKEHHKKDKLISKKASET